MSDLKLKAICKLLNSLLPPLTKEQIETVRTAQQPQSLLLLNLAVDYKADLPQEFRSIAMLFTAYLVVGLETNEEFRMKFDNTIKQFIARYMILGAEGYQKT